MIECVCGECGARQTEQLVYDKITCNNFLHLLLTVVTGIWVFVWIYKRKNSQAETAYNRRCAIFVLTCNECGGSLGEMGSE
jgi:hypothetical protein